MVASIDVGPATALPRRVTTWILDPARTEVAFAVGLMGMSTVTGRFHRVAGSLTDEEVTLRIETASIDTGNAMRDRHLRGRDILAGDRYPFITFVSTAIAPVDAVTYAVTGDLTIRGHARRISLTVTCDEPDAAMVERRCFAVETRLSRKAFGVGPSPLNFGMLIGNDVTVRIRGEGVAT